MEAPPLHLYSLPNEVFVQILSPFSTRELLPLSSVSQRFHALVLRLLHYRLLVSASLKEYKLILECYHPTSKLTEPHVFCSYLGTDGLSDRYEGEGSLYENLNAAQKLGRLSSLYSRFKPEVAADEVSNGADVDDESPDPDASVVKRTIIIDGFEDFSQLCVVVNVVKVLPGTNLLLSAVNVEDGVVRLFQDRLKRLASRPWHSEDQDDSSSEAEDQILWADASKNVGVKLRVREVTKLDESFPVLVHRDEELFSTYEISIDELHIRTTRLLLTLEKSIQEQQSYPKAVVFTRSMG